VFEADRAVFEELIEAYHTATGQPSVVVDSVPVRDEYDDKFISWFNSEFRDHWKNETGEELEAYDTDMGWNRAAFFTR